MTTDLPVAVAPILERRRVTEPLLPKEHRYFDKRLGAYLIKVLPGGYAFAERPDEQLVTVLGSCVSACVRDYKLGFGGMNHFMLAGDSISAADSWANASDSMRYGHFAMEKLINELISRGARRERLEVKLFGGARVIDSSMDIGGANAEFARNFMRAEKLTVVAEDLGGDFPRRIHYSVANGKVQRLLLQRKTDSEVYTEEQQLRRTLSSQLKTEAPSGEVELFT